MNQRRSFLRSVATARSTRLRSLRAPAGRLWFVALGVALLAPFALIRLVAGTSELVRLPFPVATDQLRQPTQPDGLPEETVRKLLIDNPLEAYPRLRDGAVAETGVLRDNAAVGQEAMR